MWMKVDDRMHSHRKTRAVTKSHPNKTRDVAPMGLWVAAGSWSAQNGTGGWVPEDELDRWDDDWRTLADRLVKGGYWWPEEHDGEPGYGFNDWEDYNPQDARDEAARSGEYGSHVRWHVKRQMVDPDCEHCPKEPLSDPHEDQDGGHDGAYVGPNGVANSSTRPHPSRPDPIPSSASAAADDARDGSEPDRFDEFWATYDKPVGRKKAAAKYRLALKKRGVTPDLLIDAARAYIASQRAKGKHREFTKDPTTWLNGEHWGDEDVSSNVHQMPARTPFPVNGTEAEQDAWVRAQPLPTDGAYYGGSVR